MNQKSYNGFTLLEVMLTMALLALVALSASPFYGNFIFSQEVSVVSDELRGSLAKAQFSSMTGKNDASFGVAIHDGHIVLFQGSSFLSRDQSLDEAFTIHPRVSISGMSEIVFAPVTGRPDHQPTITVSGNGKTEAWVMNSEGVLEE